MKRVLATFFMPALLLGAAHADLEPAGDLFAWSPTSIAYGDGPLAAYWNPALLNRGHDSVELEFFGFAGNAADLATDLDQNFGLFTRFGSLGIGMEHVESGTAFANRYRVGLSQGGDKLKSGISYGWSVGNSELKQADQFVYGLLAQPKSWLSLGTTLTSYLGDNGDSSDLLIETGIALRPYKNYLTVSFDASWDFLKNDYIKETQQRWAGIEVRPFEFMSASVKQNLDTDDLIASANLYLNGFGLGASHSMADAGSDPDPATRYHMHMSTDYFNRIFPVKTKKKMWARLDLTGFAGEYSWMGMGKDVRLLAFLDQMDAAELDPRLKGILIDWKPDFRTDITLLHEIRTRLLEWKENTGGELVFYSHQLGTASLYLSSICDRRALLPVGEAEIPPFGREGIYWSDALENAGLDYVRFNAGAYKGAGEDLDLNAMSPEVKENVGRALTEIWDYMTHESATGFGLSAEAYKEITDRWMLTKHELTDLGLVDTLLYDDELEDWVLGREKNDEDAGFKIGINLSLGSGHSDDYMVPLASLPFNTKNTTWGEKEAVAVIYANGPIMGGKSIGPIIIGDETVVAQLKAARENDRVKAVVFHIDSPGGSGYASDLIWREMMRLKEKKPLIIHQGFLAASGGYYLSMAGDSILSSPTTITGSIGVAAGILFDKGLAEAAHLHQDGVWAGSDHSIGGAQLGLPVNLEAGSASLRLPALPVMGRPLTQSQDEDIKGMIDEFYHDFVGKVADCRETDWDSIDAIAEGRIWAGGSALGINLVDGMGGLGDAIDAAIERADLPQRSKIDLIEYYPKFSLSDAMMLMGMSSRSGGIKAAMEELRLSAETKAIEAPFKTLSSGKPALLIDATPFDIEVK
jgi:protease IV